MTETMLTKGTRVRCRRGGNEPTFGNVAIAGVTTPQSVLIDLDVATGMRASDGGMFILGSLMLTVDYDAETVTDLWGNEWELDVIGVGGE